MSSSKNKRSNPLAQPAPAKPQSNQPIAMSGKRPINWSLIALFLLISVGGTYLAIWMRPKPSLPHYTYEVLAKYPHDAKAFTQGIVVDDGFVWESTGLKGESTVRKVDLKSGEVLNSKPVPDKYFAEGLTVLNDKIYQLTWKAGVGFVYDRDLNLIEQFEYDGQGWGLTTDGKHLIVSDGTPQIRFLDPETFEEVRSIWVRQAGSRIGKLNELEMFGLRPKLYANSFTSDLIYEIDIHTGDVTSVIDLAGLWPSRERPSDGLLNGIAIHPETKKMLVTGKRCPYIYEIQLKLVE